jgi:hypothetical protein
VQASQPVVPQPTFGDGVTHTPPQVFSVAAHIVGPLVLPPTLMNPPAPGAPAALPLAPPAVLAVLAVPPLPVDTPP